MNKVHYIWIIVLLLLIITGLIILICCDIDETGQPIVHYLSITATIMSIVLSIFSIAFSYYSLTSSASHWSNIQTAIGEMKEANTNINNNNQALLNNVITITRNIGALQAQIPNLTGRQRAYNNERFPTRNVANNPVRAQGGGPGANNGQPAES